MGSSWGVLPESLLLLLPPGSPVLHLESPSLFFFFFFFLNHHKWQDAFYSGRVHHSDGHKSSHVKLLMCLLSQSIRLLQVSAWYMQRRITGCERISFSSEGSGGWRTHPPLEVQQRSWALAQGPCIRPAPASPHWVVAACPWTCSSTKHRTQILAQI